jgi:phosphoribosylanthranilate isomerase
MSPWIKICGNTSLDDAMTAATAGADAVGFVFAPSPRRVKVDKVAIIAPQLPPEIEKIGVFVNAALDEIVATVQLCGLTGVQLHFSSVPQLPARLRLRLGPQLRILRAVHAGAEAKREAAAIAADPNVDAVLVDSRVGDVVGGTGVTFDWIEARKTVFSDAGKFKLIAAGGLNHANVAEAIAMLQPWGVDVASGVEASPGRKDPGKVRLFVARARAGGAGP